MLAKAELVDIVNKRIKSSIMNRRQLDEWSEQLVSKYNMPVSKATDLLTLRSDIVYENDFTLYCVANVVASVDLEKYYTKEERMSYAHMKFKSTKKTLPLTFKLVKVADDQWIGSTTAKQLMELRDAQLINYNENMQRTMRHIMNGDIEYYRIMLNKHSVKSIEGLYDNNTYVPNTITLNVNPDTVTYSYDENTSEFTISKMEHFDIIDGYHRYIAISDLSNLNEDFDYPMELRITMFSESKAQQMIWQEDQKTKMRKIESDSLNQNNFANQVINFINSDGNHLLHGKISRNRAVVNSAYLGNIIQYLYAPKVRRASDAITVRAEIANGLNNYISANPTELDSSWSFEKTLAIIALIQENKCTKGNVTKMTDELDEIQKKHITSQDVTRIRNIAKGV